jgi:hypothetical protein
MNPSASHFVAARAWANAVCAGQSIRRTVATPATGSNVEMYRASLVTAIEVMNAWPSAGSIVVCLPAWLAWTSVEWSRDVNVCLRAGLSENLRVTTGRYHLEAGDERIQVIPRVSPGAVLRRVVAPAIRKLRAAQAGDLGSCLQGAEAGASAERG